ncbi:MAG: adenine deaminase [Candidatus Izemoplasmatales bacterium]|nr:adenine deaminase [Candidatus Izemoplasmatales bacterium]
MDKKKLLAVARGEELADLVIKNAKIINVFTKDIDNGDLAVCDGYIVGIGDYQGKEEIDLLGYYLSPGFIDGHVHIESSMLTPNNYALAIMPRGTTAVVADCHEIANVKGLDGIDFMLEASKNSPLDVYMMIPSCVPSTEFETTGAILEAKDIKKYLKLSQVIGLGEMMDYPGTINGKQEVLDKLETFKKLTIDGHAPEVKDKELNAYCLAGIKTDHECTTPEELLDKVKRGMYVHLREGSQTKNVRDLLKGLDPKFYQRIMFCSDDLHPRDIRRTGHIDNNINIAIKNGIEPISAISMATINIADCYNLRDVGAISPGRKADFVLFKSLDKIDVEAVYKQGKLVAENKKPLFTSSKIDTSKVIDTVKFDETKIDLEYKLNSDLVNVIGLVKNNVTTKKLIEKVVLKKGIFLTEENPVLLKLCVIERHFASGNIGKAIVKGYGLKAGAIAMTIAHDSHNVICIGDNDLDMLLAIKQIKNIGGGIVVASKGKVKEFLPLEVGGLMSLDSLEDVESKLTSLEKYARGLGVSKDIEDPFLQLAFLSLAVIPDLKITDKGLFDVKEFKIIPLEAGDK